MLRAAEAEHDRRQRGRAERARRQARRPRGSGRRAPEEQPRRRAPTPICTGQHPRPRRSVSGCGRQHPDRPDDPRHGEQRGLRARRHRRGEGPDAEGVLRAGSAGVERGRRASHPRLYRLFLPYRNRTFPARRAKRSVLVGGSGSRVAWRDPLGVTTAMAPSPGDRVKERRDDALGCSGSGPQADARRDGLQDRAHLGCAKPRAQAAAHAAAERDPRVGGGLACRGSARAGSASGSW